MVAAPLGGGSPQRGHEGQATNPYSDASSLLDARGAPKTSAATSLASAATVRSAAPLQRKVTMSPQRALRRG